MAKTIYLVTSGSYSDYSVCAAFEREEDALRMKADARMEGDYVEEMIYFGKGEQPEVATVYHARGAYGNLDSVECDYAPTVTEGGYDWPPPSRPQVRENVHLRHDERGVTAKCVDRDAAIKAVKDRIAARMGRGVEADEILKRRAELGL